MTRERIEAILDVLEIEYRYHHFEECEAVNPPFICWLIPETRNFSADGKVYFKSDKVDIELYTDEKDFELEERVEAALDAADLFWQKSEQYIKSKLDGNRYIESEVKKYSRQFISAITVNMERCL